MALMNLFARQQWTNRHTEQSYGHRGEERVRCRERVTWKLTLPYVRLIANGNFPYVSGNANRVSVTI